MKIRFFASLADVTGTSEINFPAERNLGRLKESIIESYPELAGKTFTLAVNHKAVHDPAFPLKDEDEIALLPPFSGG